MTVYQNLVFVSEGDLMVYQNWVRDQPEGLDQMCAAIERFAGGNDPIDHYKWNDLDCNGDPNNYICKLSKAWHPYDVTRGNRSKVVNKLRLPADR